MKRKLKHLSTGARFRLNLGQEANVLIGFTNQNKVLVEKSQGLQIIDLCDQWVYVIGHTKINRKKLGIFSPIQVQA